MTIVPKTVPAASGLAKGAEPIRELAVILRS
jgi:hypothetical protein